MTPRTARRRLTPSAALTLTALLALTGCGQATRAAEAPASPPSSAHSSDPSAQWPTVGCDSRSVVSIDHGRMPTGAGTPEEAVENSPAVALLGGVLTPAPYPGKGPAHVWVVDPETQEIRAEVSVIRGPDGWFVDGVTTCG